MRRTLFTIVAGLLLALAPTHSAKAQSSDIIQTLQSAGNFGTLISAISTAGLTETFKGPGPYTVFAPSDEAFAAVPKARLDALLADRDALKSLLLYHVVPGKVMAADASRRSGRPARTASGVNATISVSGSTVKVNDATVVKADVAASNGVVHIIDSVIWPPE